MYQRFEIIARLGSDPEMRFLPDGTQVASFNAAVNKSWTDKSGAKQEKTTWVRVTAWRQQAENCAKYLHKGDQVFVEGEVEARAWTDKAGQQQASLELSATRVVFLRTSGNGSNEQAQPAQSQPAVSNASDDSIPF